MERNYLYDDMFIFSFIDKHYLKVDELNIYKGNIIIPISIDDVKSYDDNCKDMLKYVDECTVKYDTVNKHIVIEVNSFAVIHRYDLQLILDKIKLYGKNEYNRFKDMYDDFEKFLVYITKFKIRNKIKSIYLTGKFVSDNIANDTYMQSRIVNNDEYFWIINQWWDKINSPIEFINIGNDNTIFIAK